MAADPNRPREARAGRARRALPRSGKPPVGVPYELFSLLLRINISIYKKAQPNTAVPFYTSSPVWRDPLPHGKRGAALSPLPRSCGDALTETLDTARILEYNIETYYHYYKRAGRVALPERRKL